MLNHEEFVDRGDVMVSSHQSPTISLMLCSDGWGGGWDAKSRAMKSSSIVVGFMSEWGKRPPVSSTGSNVVD